MTATMDRRDFLARTAAAGLAVAAGPATAGAATLFVATNTYPWTTFASRDRGTFVLHSDEALAAIASAGFTGYEPIINDVAEFEGLEPRLRAHGLEMRSLYVNSTLHDESTSAASTAHVLAIARRAVEIGTLIIVTNPSPIRWGGPENKTDQQIRAQAAALDRLGRELRALGLTLAYHNHDAELRLGAREFHHMLTATDPAHVKFCLDAHWVFRGCGDSQVALFDAVEHYGQRIVELHLRQSRRGVWSEVFGADADIDYERLGAWLEHHDVRPQLTLEQAVEKGSPSSLDAVTAHRQGLAVVGDVFRWLGRPARR
jgi:inosose dehydratase